MFKLFRKGKKTLQFSCINKIKAQQLEHKQWASSAINSA